MKKFSDYLQDISALNRLGNIKGNDSNAQWLFYPGMLFSSKDKWWGDWQYRPLPHEGIDICFYRLPAEKKLACFDESIQIPAMDSGIVLNICDDFLGQTLVVEHPASPAATHTVFYTYAHIFPEKGLKKGSHIQKGQTIARVCDTHKNPQLPPHLHFSCFESLHPVQDNTLDWNLFSDPDKVNMIHPVFL